MHDTLVFSPETSGHNCYTQEELWTEMLPWFGPVGRQRYVSIFKSSPARSHIFSINLISCSVSMS